jgi:hypothetical protein
MQHAQLPRVPSEIGWHGSVASGRRSNGQITEPEIDPQFAIGLKRSVLPPEPFTIFWVARANIVLDGPLLSPPSPSRYPPGAPSV